jgi:5'-nucleotidase
VTRPHIHAIVNHFLAHPLPPGTILNVNFPLNCAQGVKGVRIAKQGRGYFLESPDRRIHPEGIPYYWLGGKWNEVDGEDPESDVSLLAEGYIACVPIRVGELTDHPAFEKHRSMFIQSLRV